MEKSFYYSVAWSKVGYIKDTLMSLHIPFAIEQPHDRLQLNVGEVAIVFPDLHVQVYRHVHELFGSAGRSYPF